MCPKIQSVCLFPLKMPSLKNPDPESLCKKWGVWVSHVEKQPVLEKKTFFATTRVVPFFSGNSKGDDIDNIPRLVSHFLGETLDFRTGSYVYWVPRSSPMVLSQQHTKKGRSHVAAEISVLKVMRSAWKPIMAHQSSHLSPMLCLLCIDRQLRLSIAQASSWSCVIRASPKATLQLRDRAQLRRATLRSLTGAVP